MSNVSGSVCSLWMSRQGKFICVEVLKAEKKITFEKTMEKGNKAHNETRLYGIKMDRK